ncbi:MAG: AI-2E family transporter [Bacteroidetes bacterium]|nr:MAG: AI-2E family transporter [Bacteroidota bacterium]MBL1144603.1 AI-2E family transporter [Bacteroidota bacterium]MCB0802292.1 AI-2E family transporter [Flavobacteriales bacterium]NOG57398.1 AI-2E family transporter [Bacteroidota bacterium]
MSEKQSISIGNLWKVLLTLTLLVYALMDAKAILIPIVFSAFLTVILNPIVSFLEKRKFPTWLAIIMTIILLLLLISLLVYFISTQSKSLLNDMPDLMGKYNQFLNKLEEQVGLLFGVYGKDQIALLKENSTSLISSGTGFLTNFINATSSLLSFFTIVPIYIVFMLLSRNSMRQFLIALGKKNNRNFLKIGREIKEMILSYIGGLFIVVAIISALNTIGLLSLGIKHAVFLGVLSGALTIIPYIGILIGGAVPVFVALLTKDSLFYPIAVVALIALVQFLEGNFITPKVIGSKVNISALAAIIALLIGASIWGIIGMILAIPMIGIVKIIFSHVDSLKPYAILLAEKVEEEDSKP